MVDKIIYATPLYGFLRECQKSPLKKEVLDCGAGGYPPPLALFNKNGYVTYGIDITESQIKEAQKYCQENNIELNITKGDIRAIPFERESISFIYSYNTSIFLSKNDTQLALNEIERVLKPNGLCFINFLSIDDEDFGIGEKLNEGEYLNEPGYFDWTEEKMIQTFYKDTEPDKYFKNFEVIRKEKRIVERKCNDCNKIHKQAFIDYIAKKQSNKIQ
ncbi:MAG: class I SAM-dependent methyltransferase [Candidatus Hodarchaeales archaeon]|jgi:ubiquinone/menaquinone biosynthesis C-methylase UbiE